ncbi:MAG: high-potential iron-sulfur protein [Leptonema sp. (in: bacteria)]
MKLKENFKVSRKDFLIKTSMIGISFVLGSNLVQCKKEEQKEQAQKTGPHCDDTNGLSKEDIEQRKNLQYTDHTPKADQKCENCALYVVAEGNSPCGKCNLIKGPVSPLGWCTSWVPKA